MVDGKILFIFINDGNDVKTDFPIMFDFPHVGRASSCHMVPFFLMDCRIRSVVRIMVSGFDFYKN